MVTEMSLDPADLDNVDDLTLSLATISRIGVKDVGGQPAEVEDRIIEFLMMRPRRDREPAYSWNDLKPRLGVITTLVRHLGPISTDMVLE
ncbi:hypothetical protein DYI24_00295 [Rhodopseudomonas sp. BR0C11]|uniref:hypothetical protein n=1 Tax=Rhodopseudomonas TaxID=1073 RepID=UPI0019676B34|nr:MULTISPECIES: hypothetical protein [Rhodopseudomonas]NEV75521.1 hypothetical protein [Rhodopseudomonas sp. BR0C11]WBU27533.1 hypothetical protein OOZ54_12595 [Rhodopseudomonas palustris]